MKAHKQYIGLGVGVVLCTLFIGAALFRFRKPNQRILTIDFSKFDSPDRPGSGRCIDKTLLVLLDRLAQQTGLPIFDWINSGVRTPNHNRKVGGVSNSSHLIPICKAVDIKAPNTAIRNLIVMTAQQVGFKRIGVGKTFVHLDVDTRKAQNVAWGYPSGTPPEVNPFV